MLNVWMGSLAPTTGRQFKKVKSVPLHLRLAPVGLQCEGGSGRLSRLARGAGLVKAEAQVYGVVALL